MAMVSVRVDFDPETGQLHTEAPEVPAKLQLLMFQIAQAEIERELQARAVVAAFQRAAEEAMLNQKLAGNGRGRIIHG